MKEGAYAILLAVTLAVLMRWVAEEWRSVLRFYLGLGLIGGVVVLAVWLMVWWYGAGPTALP